MGILIKNARVLTMDDQYHEYDKADILVDGTRIVAIEPELQAGGPDARIIDASGKLAMPGLVNGHIHSPGNFMNGALDDLPLEIFMLYEVPPLSDTPPSSRLNYVRTMLGNIEMLKLGITAVHDDAFHAALSEMSKELDVPFDIHILETKLQRVLGQVKYGKSLVKYVHDLGLLDEHMMVIHAIWVDDEDVQLMKEAGVSIAHNPVCNLRLGSGLMTWRRMHDHGIPVCLGSDEGCVDDTANMWQVGKMAGLLHTLAEPDYALWPKAREVMWALTRGGAHAMRNEGKVGQLKVGCEADLILLDLNTIAFTPLNDIYRQLVYCENGSSVIMTMVAGRIVMQDGRVLTVDEESIKQEVRELMPFYHKEIEKTHIAAARLEPYYREMYLKCASIDVGMNRWVGDAWKRQVGS